MNRPRLSRVFPVTTAIVLAAALTSGCSTFDNSLAAQADERKLTIDELNEIAADFPIIAQDETLGVDEFGEYSGDAIRNVLVRWVQAASLLNELEAQGVVIDETQRTAAAAQYDSTDSETWQALSPATQEFLIDFTVGRTALVEDQTLISDAQVEEAYNAGVDESGVLCIRIMAFDTEEEAAAVREELDNGADFATLANEHPITPDAATSGGVFTDQQTGSPCVSAGNYAVLAQAVGTTPIGEPTAPIPLESFYFLMLQRPFDEVAAEARAVMAPALVAPLVADLARKASVHIDSRYGMWDAETGAVVPTR